MDGALFAVLLVFYLGLLGDISPDGSIGLHTGYDYVWVLIEGRTFMTIV